MPLHFAYGMNMDVAAMASRCPASRPLGPARLAGHDLAFLAGGHATVRRRPGVFTHGVLWELALADVAALDRFEEVGRGLYAKSLLPVLRQTGGPVRALVYVGTPSPAGRPIPAMMRDMAAAARRQGLPAAYVARLEMLGERTRTPEGPRPRGLKP